MLDPVCGLVIHDEEGAPYTDYKGKHFCFCSEQCKEEFNMDPEMYSTEGEVALEEEETF